MNKKAILLFSALLLIAPMVFAADGDIEAIMEPLNKIYELVTQIITVVAVLAITYAGIKFMFSGDNIQEREGAKHMVAYCIAGLVVIWVAPLLVDFLTAPAA